MWLSRENLLQLIDPDEATAEKASRVVDADGQADVGHTFAPSRLPRACPSCNQAMENFAFDESGIWLDACNQGHGIWLDQGELKLLAKRRRNGDPGDDDDGAALDAVSDLILGSL
jgi:hypothetical protein